MKNLDKLFLLAIVFAFPSSYVLASKKAQKVKVKKTATLAMNFGGTGYKRGLQNKNSDADVILKIGKITPNF